MRQTQYNFNSKKAEFPMCASPAKDQDPCPCGETRYKLLDCLVCRVDIHPGNHNLPTGAPIGRTAHWTGLSTFDPPLPAAKVTY